MSMLSLWRKFVALFLVLVVSGCGGGSGSSAPAPSGFAVAPGNGQVTITWVADPGVEYWLMYAATATPIDMKNPPGGHVWATNITSPFVLTGLTNGVTYSFAMNGRTGGAKGGPQTASLSTAPRFAGSSWTTFGSTGTSDLLGVTYASANASYVTVGTGGKILTGATGASWTAVTPAPTIDFRAVTYVSAAGKVVAVGAATSGSNNVSYSSNTTTWSNTATVGNTALNAVATDGTTVVAVGDGGKVFYSTDAVTWNAATGISSFTSDLYAVAYSATGLWVAVGQNGALLTSSNGIAWAAQTSIAVAGSHKLNGLAATSSGLFVAVGNQGTVLSSSNGTNWVAQSLGVATPDLFAVSTDSSQFLIVGAAGAAFTGTTDGTNWVSRTTSAADDLLAITGSVNRYVVVGRAGVNISSIN